MKIGFEFIVDESPLMIRVAEKLQKEHNIEIVGITLANRWKHLLKNKDFQLVSLSDYLKKHWDNYKVSQDAISTLEEKYGESNNLWWFIDVDRFINDINKHKFPTKEEKLKFLFLHFKFWEEVFNDYSLDIFYSSGPSFISLQTGMAVAKKIGVNFKGVYTTRLADSRIVFVDNNFDEYKDVNKIYKTVIDSRLPSEELEEAGEFIKDFRNIPQKPIYTKIFLQSLKLKYGLFLIKEFFRRIIYIYLYKWGRDKFDYFTAPLFKKTFSEISVLIKKELLTRCYFKKNALKNIKNEAYAFLPLQLQPEEACDIWSMYYSHQIAFVENVAKSLPINVKLYVKEHLPALGRRKGLYGYYEEMNKLSNVKLVHPFANTYEFIKNAKVIILNSGTVGWEALLLKKPVIIFGEAFYKYSNLVHTANSFRELKEIIKKIMNSKEIFPKDYDEKLAKFVYSLKKKTYAGYYAPYYRGEKIVLSKENIDNICLAILKDCALI